MGVGWPRWAGWLACNGARDIWGWLWFPCEMAHSEGCLISVFRGKSFLLVLIKVSFWRGRWTLGYYSMELIQFPDIS